MLRPGRLDKVLYVGLPDTDDREDILRTLTKVGALHISVWNQIDPSKFSRSKTFVCYWLQKEKLSTTLFEKKFDKCFTSLWDEKNSAILVWCSYGLKREPAKVPAMRICFSALFLGFVSETRATLSWPIIFKTEISHSRLFLIVFWLPVVITLSLVL